MEMLSVLEPPIFHKADITYCSQEPGKKSQPFTITNGELFCCGCREELCLKKKAFRCKRKGIMGTFFSIIGSYTSTCLHQSSGLLLELLRAAGPLRGPQNDCAKEMTFGSNGMGKCCFTELNVKSLSIF